jgi:DNA transformation protein
MSEYVDYLHEVFALFGPIRARKMFGGYGIYRDDVMIGLVADDTLYLEADAQTKAHFEAARLPCFEYDNGKKVIRMSYWLAPAEVLDDPDEARVWAQRAYEAALRAKQAAPRPRRRRAS